MGSSLRSVPGSKAPRAAWVSPSWWAVSACGTARGGAGAGGRRAWRARGARAVESVERRAARPARRTGWREHGERRRAVTPRSPGRRVGAGRPADRSRRRRDGTGARTSGSGSARRRPEVVGLGGWSSRAPATCRGLGDSTDTRPAAAPGGHVTSTAGRPGRGNQRTAISPATARPSRARSARACSQTAQTGGS